MAISRITQPMDHTSEDPSRPLFSFLMTSGAMYIGVPASELTAARGSAAFVRVCRAARVRATVLLPLAITFAAPKSTSLRWAVSVSSISIYQLQAVFEHILSGLISRCSTPCEWRYSRPERISDAYTLVMSSSSIRPCSSILPRLPPEQYSSKM